MLPLLAIFVSIPPLPQPLRIPSVESANNRVRRLQWRRRTGDEETQKTGNCDGDPP